jgi:prostaglandin-endoperoxide synthase 2
MRSQARDGLANQVEFHLTTHAAPVWQLAQQIAPVERVLNRTLVNRAILKIPTRPQPLSTMGAYTSWSSLTDRRYDARHLPPHDPMPMAPPIEQVTELFRRENAVTRECPKSTLLLPYFAQWFTDGFLRSDRSTPRDPRRNESNHEIDLMQIYGLNAAETRLLRAFRGGRLKSQHINGEEYPPHLCRNGRIKPEFQGLRVVRFETLTPEQRDRLFAFGSDTGNTQLGFVLMNVLFLREHNRVANLLQRRYPAWGDTRLFETSRNIVIVLLLKIVIEEYINHLAPYHFQFRLDPAKFGKREPWYRTNWMAVEFNLLYRWHSLVPSVLRVNERDTSIAETMWPGDRIAERGLGPHFDEASRQPAGRIALFNTDSALLDIEHHTIEQGRRVQLAGYNDYRAHCGFPRVTDFDQITGDAHVQKALRDVYGDVNRIEFYVGLFAEDLRPNSVLPSLMGRLVGIDAFSQALTNPLLAPRTYNADTFSRLGLEIIDQTLNLSDMVARNLPSQAPDHRVSFRRPDWQRT